MPEYLLNTTFSNYKFPMTDVNSPTIGKTGLTVSVEISNDAGSFSSSVGSVTELQSGWYILSSINSSEMVSGSIALVAMASGANNWRDIIIPESNAVNITNSAAQLVWTIPISLFETDVTTNARSPYYAIAAMVNKYDFAGAGGALQHFRIDDSTVLFSIVTSSDATANFIVAGDTV